MKNHYVVRVAVPVYYDLRVVAGSEEEAAAFALQGFELADKRLLDYGKPRAIRATFVQGIPSHASLTHSHRLRGRFHRYSFPIPSAIPCLFSC